MNAIALHSQLRALMMFNTLPEGCIAFLNTDDYSLPHIRAGEFVVVDTNDHTPRNGELYCVQFDSGRRCLGQTRVSIHQPKDKPDTQYWTIGALRNPGPGVITKNMPLNQALAICGWSDGPYDDLEYLSSKLVGSVIGIYQPNFEEPKRVIS